MEDACSDLAAYRRTHPLKHDDRRKGTRRVIALGMPIISSLTRYDGEEHDDMRVPQARPPRSQPPALLVA